ncbi:hypothetical protein DRJ48_03125, partial [Candidatus Woesearchaeota archaeon]
MRVRVRKPLLRVLVLVILLSFSAGLVSAQPNYVISNSQDWRDVYSTQLYANLIGSKPYFLVSMRHSTLLLNQLAKGPNVSALVVSSSRLPYVINYASMLSTVGIPAEELNVYSANLELASRLNVTNFIVLDDNYGYNAISVAPYAVVKRAYVLFADRNNIDEVVRFLSTRDRVDELIIYGIVDREVVDSLQGFNPVIINKGDRFSDNVEIVKRYQAIKHAKQAVLTNGEFIEREIMSGEEPVIFIGRNNVPDVVRDYIKDSEIEIGVLIGNDLVGTATFVRRTLGISVFVKFAQSARNPRGPISRVEALDMFNVPKVKVDIDIAGIAYNTATGLIEVTYQNLEDIATFLKGTITLTSEQGERQVVGDTEPIFLDPSGIKTLTYEVDRFAGENLSARAFVIYGEAPNSLEFVIDKKMGVSKISVLDKARVNVTGVWYDWGKRGFLVEVENIGDVDCFVDIELRELKIGYNIVNLGLEQPARLKVGEKKRLRISTDEEILPEDIDKNKIVKLRVYYGERENALVNMLESDFV